MNEVLVMNAGTVSLGKEKSDVTMLDNMRIAHARSPFKGPRKAGVAMA